MIRQIKDLFVLDTDHTTYLFRIAPTGHLEHLYYGETIDPTAGVQSLIDPRRLFCGNLIAYSHQDMVAMEDVSLELSAPGHGDQRMEAVDIAFGDGSHTADFKFRTATITENVEKKPLDGLPSSYFGNHPGQVLSVTLTDQRNQVDVVLTYSVFPHCDVITRSARIVNRSGATIQILRAMSLQLDIDRDDFRFVTFKGHWGREMEKFEQACTPGMLSSGTRCGSSSNRANPFFMLQNTNATENDGDCYGFHLVYSGNHWESAEVNSFGRLRLLQGIHPDGFCWTLADGDHFDTPEAVMTFSPNGANGVSCNLHPFIQHHIVRGVWQYKERPILINSWESFYFHFNEASLLELAKEGKELGMELFVLDDGWFGKRNDDLRSLGDWQVNTEKLPDGLAGLCDKINAMGMDFGLWVEPESTNVDSNLYRAHPDWIIGRADQSDGRTQMLLDLGRVEVQDFIIDAMTEVFQSCNLSYVKWDVNRIFSDTFASYLPADRQGEVAHRYMLGFYRVMETLTERFPHILFEGCASGGNRFDCGMLCYFPQIWASDNTDALCRVEIQNGYLYGYPQSTLGCHVAAVPNHQTMRITPMDSRFQVAAFGALGYELNLTELPPETKDQIREQIIFYKARRSLFQFGQIYHNKARASYVWTVVDQDQDHAASLYFKERNYANPGLPRLPVTGLDPHKVYHFTNRQLLLNLETFGGISLPDEEGNPRMILPSETEDMTAYGSVLMKGVKVKPPFGGSGFNRDIRLMPDHGSRIYLFDALSPASLSPLSPLS